MPGAYPLVPGTIQAWQSASVRLAQAQHRAYAATDEGCQGERGNSDYHIII